RGGAGGEIAFGAPCARDPAGRLPYPWRRVPPGAPVPAWTNLTAGARQQDGFALRAPGPMLQSTTTLPNDDSFPPVLDVAPRRACRRRARPTGRRCRAAVALRLQSSALAGGLAGGGRIARRAARRPPSRADPVRTASRHRRKRLGRRTRRARRLPRWWP